MRLYLSVDIEEMAEEHPEVLLTIIIWGEGNKWKTSSFHESR